ncbi:EexN family lipoprotein [Escherichia coli]|nr:EexN family lipoprotein [Escherichia coli]MCQ5564481.1 EexN family lipoprotein [Escherichia coli]MCQ5584698.1 EexN family lipoprotein [Escherichia coli]
MNKSRNTIIASSIILVASMLSGCNDKVYSIEYYSNNLNEAAKTLEDCKKGTITDQNCDNARAALQQKQDNEYKKKVSELRRRLD